LIKKILLFFLCLSLFLSIPCKKTPTTPDVPVLPTIEYFNANPDSIKFGESSTLSWSVTNATTVTIDQGIGAVSAKDTKQVNPEENTTYNLTAKNNDGQKSQSCMITVNPIASAVDVTSIKSTIYVGQREQMTATVTMSDGTTKAATGTWGSDNMNVATVNQSGLVTGVSAGNATIFIDTTSGLRGSKKMKVRNLWSKSGKGDSVFNMPTYVSRVRVIGTYTGYSSNFIVYVDGWLLVNELLGTGWGTTTYDGTLLTSGGVVEIKYSSGVSWSFTQVLTTTAITNISRKITNIPSQSDSCYREYEIYKRVAAEKK